MAGRAVGVAARKLNAERALRVAEAGRELRHPRALGRLGERQRHQVDARRAPFAARSETFTASAFHAMSAGIVVGEKVHARDDRVRLQHQFGAGRGGEHRAIVLEPERTGKPCRQRRQEFADEIVLTLDARRRRHGSTPVSFLILPRTYSRRTRSRLTHQLRFAPTELGHLGNAGIGVRWAIENEFVELRRLDRSASQHRVDLSAMMHLVEEEMRQHIVGASDLNAPGAMDAGFADEPLRRQRTAEREQPLVDCRLCVGQRPDTVERLRGIPRLGAKRSALERINVEPIDREVVIERRLDGWEKARARCFELTGSELLADVVKTQVGKPVGLGELAEVA